MKLQSILIENFKGIEKREVVFGKTRTTLLGANEKGKTSIKDAVLFALTGYVDNSPNIDGVIREGTKEMAVSLRMSFDGSEYLIERKKTVDKAPIKIDGKPATQEEIYKIFGSNQKLLTAAFDSGAFMKYDNATKRNLLISILPEVSREEIYKEIVGETIAKKYPIGGNPDLDLKTRKDELKTAKENIVANASSKTAIAAQIEQTEKIAAETKPVITVNDGDVEGIKMKVDMLESDAPKAPQAAASKPMPQEGEKIISLRVQLQAKTSELNSLSAGGSVCPTCKRAFDNAAEIEAHKTALQKEIDSLTAEGKKERAAYDATVATWKAEQDQAAKATEGQNAEYAKAMTAWKEKLSAARQALYDIQEKYQAGQSAVAQAASIQERVKDLKKQLKAKEAGDAVLAEIVEELTTVVAALSPRGIQAKETEKKLSEARKLLPKEIEIVLLKQNKSNENVQEVFELTYEGHEYAWLSTGRKAQVDFEIAKLFARKTNIGAIFFDNAESVTTPIEAPQTIQLILAQAEKGKDFSIEKQ